MCQLTCQECGASDVYVIRDWRRIPDSADAPVVRCCDLARDRCVDRQRQAAGLAPFLVTCATCGERLPRIDAFMGHVHIGGVGEVVRFYCPAGAGHRKGEVMAAAR
jgi:hypothetical protein